MFNLTQLTALQQEYLPTSWVKQLMKPHTHMKNQFPMAITQS